MEGSIRDFLDYIKLEKNYSPHTISSYEKDLFDFYTYLRDQFEEEDVAKVSHIYIRSWLSEMVSNGAAITSVRRKLSSLKSYFKYLLRNRIIEKNPLEKVVAPKAEKKLPNYVDDTSLSELLDFLKDSKMDLEDKKKWLILLTLYHTGMRRAELINLKDRDIDFSNRTLKVLGKRNKERIIPFTRELEEEMKKYLMEKNESYDSEYVFVTKTGKKLYPGYVYKAVNELLKRASVAGKKSPHVLRHSFATNLLNKGADLNAIKELLGHANLSATQIYTQNSIEKLKNIHKLTHPKSRS